jgi:hypothetical protein
MKWHQAHTTCFFETFVLRPFLPDYAPFREEFRWLFNSYYTRSARMLRTNSIADRNVRTSNPVKSVDPYPADRMIALIPLRIPGLVFEEPGPKSEGHGGRDHRHAGVPGIGVLDRIRDRMRMLLMHRSSSSRFVLGLIAPPLVLRRECNHKTTSTEYFERHLRPIQ